MLGASFGAAALRPMQRLKVLPHWVIAVVTVITVDGGMHRVATDMFEAGVL